MRSIIRKLQDFFNNKKITSDKDNMPISNSELEGKELSQSEHAMQFYTSTYWDKWWNERLEADRTRTNILAGYNFLREVSHLQEIGVKRILFVGCGISQVPKILAIHDFEVRAIDLSSVAIEYAKDFYYDYDDFYKIHAPLPNTTNKKKWEKYLTSSATYEVADIRDITDFEKKYELVVIEKTLQYYSPSLPNLKTVIGNIANLMADTSYLYIHSHGLRGGILRDNISNTLEEFGINKSQSHETKLITNKKLSGHLIGSG